MQRSLTERLTRSRLLWAGHVDRMADDRLPKRAAELREQGRRRRGRPRLRWEDCVKRDMRKAGEEEDCKKKTRDREGWKRLSDEAVKKLWAAPHPWQREKEEERATVFVVVPFRQIVSPLGMAHNYVGETGLKRALNLRNIQRCTPLTVYQTAPFQTRQILIDLVICW